VPSWTDDPAIGSRLINARADTVADKPALRSAFKSRCCLVVADGFFEWQATGGEKKKPYLFTLKGHQPFAFAGLWERWQRGDEHEVLSCTLITTEANELERFPLAWLTRRRADFQSARTD
jgi:putative SOS response-associated peptidase YedK